MVSRCSLFTKCCGSGVEVSPDRIESPVGFDDEIGDMRGGCVIDGCDATSVSFDISRLSDDDDIRVLPCLVLLYLAWCIYADG